MEIKIGGEWLSQMNYKNALEKLMSLIDLERIEFSGPRQKAIYDLSRIQNFLNYIGNPHLDVPCIHVAGTKGKGSVSAICESVLNESGFKTGFFSSPHIHSFTERIRINGEPISTLKFSEYFHCLWSHHETWTKEVSGARLTLFEYITALAFYIFEKESVDISVIEVGLGGRLDATNVVIPEVSAITALGYDHMNILGSDIESITKEKAGIIKPHVPVVVSHQSYDVIDIIQSVCAANNSNLIDTDENFCYSLIRIENHRQCIFVTSPSFSGELNTALLGAHQAQNVLTALGVIQELKRKDWIISEEHIKQGVYSVSWPCRMEIIESESQTVVLDGAHTYESIQLVMESIQELFQYNKLGILLGLSKDKEIDKICELLSRSTADLILLIKSRHPKAMDQKEILEYFTENNNTVKNASSIFEAISTARKELGPEALILSIGSLFSSAEVREYLLGIDPELYQAIV